MGGPRLALRALPARPVADAAVVAVRKQPRRALAPAADVPGAVRAPAVAAQRAPMARPARPERLARRPAATARRAPGRELRAVRSPCTARAPAAAAPPRCRCAVDGEARAAVADLGGLSVNGRRMRRPLAVIIDPIRSLIREGRWSASRFEPDHHGLRRRGVADVGRAVERHQHVGLGEVRRAAAPRGRVADDPEARRAPVDRRRRHSPTRSTIAPSASPSAARSSGFTKTTRRPLLDAAVAVVEAVDRGVVLVVRCGPSAAAARPAGPPGSPARSR